MCFYARNPLFALDSGKQACKQASSVICRSLGRMNCSVHRDLLDARTRGTSRLSTFSTSRASPLAQARGCQQARKKKVFLKKKSTRADFPFLSSSPSINSQPLSSNPTNLQVRASFRFPVYGCRRTCVLFSSFRSIRKTTPKKFENTAQKTHLTKPSPPPPKTKLFVPSLRRRASCCLFLRSSKSSQVSFPRSYYRPPISTSKVYSFESLRYFLALLSCLSHNQASPSGQQQLSAVAILANLRLTFQRYEQIPSITSSRTNPIRAPPLSSHVRPLGTASLPCTGIHPNTADKRSLLLLFALSPRSLSTNCLYF